MSYSIPSSTKILSLTASSFLFILVAAMSSVNLLWCTDGTDIHIQQHSPQKVLINPCLSLHYYGKAVLELEKNANKELNSVYVPYNQIEWHVFCWYTVLQVLKLLLIKKNKR